VGVGEHDRIDLLDRHWQPEVFLVAFVPPALKQAAIENDRLACSTKNVARPGDLSRCADEFEFHDSLE
jgi:hypothetical protein